MPPIDPYSLVLGLLLSLPLLAPLALWAVRAWHQRGRAAGRAEREPELATLAAERAGLRAELDAVGDQLQGQRALVDQLRSAGERLGNERAALLVRAERVGTLEHDLEQARADRDGAQRQVAELSARLDEQQRAAGERLREIEGARERMKTEFQALAAQILDDKVRRLGEHSGEQLGQLLMPLRDQLDGFRKAVDAAYEKESGARIALQTEVRQLLELNHKLGAEANSLTRALTSDSRSQGYWGEIKLERLLELAGLERGREYLVQESFRDADGDLYRPDAVLRLPGGRDIVIDAKVNLTDYQRACDEVDSGLRDGHLGLHVAAMRRHVLQLGKKDYSRLQGLSSPEIVFMFVPVEGAFLEALRRDSALYDDAFRNRIIPVGPSNLLASLSLVAQVWRTEEQNRNAQLIAERAGGLYDKLVGFVDDMGKVGDALDKAQKTHQSALGKLAQGKGNLIRKAEQLRGLGVAPGKRLPGALLDLSSADEADAGAGDPTRGDDSDEPASTDGTQTTG